ncbi:hypothetical protein LSAT2_025883 [Lamellibrachia satsuma]|nr:hypothetical protein LSAT2_025883 [Lamellibrachia satsuma]
MFLPESVKKNKKEKTWTGLDVAHTDTGVVYCQVIWTAGLWVLSTVTLKVHRALVGGGILADVPSFQRALVGEGILADVPSFQGPLHSHIEGPQSSEDVVKSNSFVLFHHFDVKLEFTRGERSSEMGTSKSNAAILISVIGISNTVGRVIFGWLSDCECVNRLFLYNLALTFCSIGTSLSIFCLNYEMLWSLHW